MVTHARTIPFWGRWIGMLFVCTVILIGSMLVIGRALPVDPNQCLIFSDVIQNSAEIDQHTGATIGFNRHYPLEIVRSVEENQVSPDNLHIAYSRYDTLSARVQLFVKAIDHIGVQSSTLVQPMVGAVNFTPYSPPRYFDWSPDGHWLAYWWQMPNGGVFLGVSDTKGHIVSTKPLFLIPSSGMQGSVFFHGWSADSQYLAMSFLVPTTGQYTISLWAAPNLAYIRSTSYRRLKDEAITPLSNPDQLALWSSNGHQIAYLGATADLQQLQLGVISPDRAPMLTGLPITPKVPLNNGELPIFNWSPDERHLALIRLSPFRHWLEVIDPVAQTVQTLTDQAMPLESVNAVLYTHWASDGQSLFYARFATSTTNQGNVDIVAFRLTDKQSLSLIPDVYDNAIETLDGHDVIYKQSIWENNVESIDAVVFNLETGSTLSVPGFSAEYATSPFYLLGETDSHWLAIGDALQVGYYVLVCNLTSGVSYRLPDIALETDRINDGLFQLLAPDGRAFASLPYGGDKVAITNTKDDALHTTFVDRQMADVSDLFWSSDSKHVTMLLLGLLGSTSKTLTNSLIVIDTNSGSVHRIEPLSDRYSNLNYVACR